MANYIYKSLKRSISAVTGNNSGESSSVPSTSQNSKYHGKSGRTWIHPPDVLINGRVEYVARFLGTVEVSKAQGSDVAKEAIRAINFQRSVKRSEQTRDACKAQKVDIQISIDSVVVADTKTKQILYTFPLSRISFCADDKDDKRMVSFIARAEGSKQKHGCFVFISEKMAEEITLTIGEAFDLAYKRYFDKNRSSLENEKQVLNLRKRIAELEAENQVLSQRLQEAVRPNKAINNHITSIMDTPIQTRPPALPTSPMPQAPPANVSSDIYSTPKRDDILTPPLDFAPKLEPIATNIEGTSTISGSSTPSSTSPSGPAPVLPPPRIPALVPPPPVAPRRNFVSPKSSIVDSGKQLEGLDLGTVKKVGQNVFDDSFDPRADEKKEAYDPFGEDFMSDKLQQKASPKPEASTSTAKPSSAPKTAADFQALIDNVEMKLAEMTVDESDDFEFGEFETGELRGVEVESEYGTPSDRLNPQVMNLKK